MRRRAVCGPSAVLAKTGGRPSRRVSPRLTTYLSARRKSINRFRVSPRKLCPSSSYIEDWTEIKSHLRAERIFATRNERSINDAMIKSRGRVGSAFWRFTDRNIQLNIKDKHAKPTCHAAKKNERKIAQGLSFLSFYRNYHNVSVAMLISFNENVRSNSACSPPRDGNCYKPRRHQSALFHFT